MLLNCQKCRNLNIEYVNNASGLDLHRFNWLDNDNEIGEIKGTWNSLVKDTKNNNDASLIHWTLGGLGLRIKEIMIRFLVINGLKHGKTQFNFMNEIRKNFIIAVPGRLESSRLPNKLLLELGGKSIITRVLENCLKAFDKDKIIFCTDSQTLSYKAKELKISSIITKRMSIRK